MPAEEIVVLTLANDAYTMPLAVTVRSLLDHLGPVHSVRVLILDGGVTDASKSQLTRSWQSSPAWTRCAITWVTPSYGGFSTLPVWGRMPLLTFARISVADYVGPEIEKLILLDSDVLVLEDLGRLWATPFDDALLCAAQDPFIPVLSAREGLASYRDFGLSADAKYFNAGVMLIDVTRWREQEVAARVFDFIARHSGRLRYYDQDALNGVLAGRWKQIDPRWNVHPRLTSLSPSRRDSPAWIVHFSGRLKPWAFRGRTAADRAFFEHLDRTAWRGWRPPLRPTTVALSLYVGILRRHVYPLEVRANGLWRKVTQRRMSVR